jgi:transposase-like protein
VSQEGPHNLQLRFPIHNLAELIQALKVLDATYPGAGMETGQQQGGLTTLIQALEDLNDDAAAPDVREQARSTACPVCHEGSVVEIEIRSTEIVAYWCAQCDALWARFDEIAASDFTTYRAFMEVLGHPADRAEIAERGPATGS